MAKSKFLIRKETFIAMRETMNNAEIQAALGVCSKTITNWARKFNCEPKKRGPKGRLIE